MRAPIRTLTATACLLALGSCQLGRATKDASSQGPSVVEVACQSWLLAGGLLIEWDAAELNAQRVTGELERSNGEDWELVSGVALEPTGFASLVAQPLPPGEYRTRLEWLDELGRPVGRATVPGTVPVPIEAPLRFLGVSEDLGLGEPLGLRLLWAFRSDSVDPERTEFAGDARRIAQLVLDRAAGASYPVDAPHLLAVEDARDLLLGASEGERVLPHALGANALAVVDLRTGSAGSQQAQLGLSLFDLSYRRYQLEQTELRLFNARPLLFEDHVELELDPEGNRHVDALLGAWRELLGELENDPYVQQYVAFLTNEGPGPLVGGAAQKELLNLIGVELSTAGDVENFEAVETDLLFLRPGARAPVAIEAAADHEAPDGDRR